MRYTQMYVLNYKFKCYIHFTQSSVQHFKILMAVKPFSQYLVVLKACTVHDIGYLETCMRRPRSHGYLKLDPFDRGDCTPWYRFWYLLSSLIQVTTHTPNHDYCSFLSDWPLSVHHHRSNPEWWNPQLVLCVFPSQNNLVVTFPMLWVRLRTATSLLRNRKRLCSAVRFIFFLA